MKPSGTKPTLRLFLCSILWIFLVPSGVYSAAREEIASSPNPVGSGARAMGMGGAFIAVADDATAASWNPGGLIQLEKPELSIVYSYYNRSEDYRPTLGLQTSSSFDVDTISAAPAVITTSTTTARDTIGKADTNVTAPQEINYLSFAYPFSAFQRNMVFSINRQHLYDFNKDVDQSLNINSSTMGSTVITLNGTVVNTIPISDIRVANETHRFRQEGGLYTISPAYAVQITPTVSVGATFNIWDDILSGPNGWTKQHEINSLEDRGAVRESSYYWDKTQYRFSGFNMNLGFLWDITEMITLGGVVKTPFKAKVRRVFSWYQQDTDVTDPVNPVPLPSSSGTIREDWHLKMPMSYGLGVAFRFSDRFSMALDVYRTEWDDFVYIQEDGTKSSPITGQAPGVVHVDETHQVRLGAEYLFIKPTTVIPVRAGLFYDPEPSPGAPQNFYGFSLGSGFMWERLVFDAAYQYRWGNDVDGIAIGVPNTKADVKQHLVLASAIWHF